MCEDFNKFFTEKIIRTIISKVIEKVVSQRLRDYLNSRNLDTKFQSAYNKDHSTETTLLKVLNDALRVADAKQPTLLVLLDLSAAFDTIDHELLLSRLDYLFGINGAALQWLRSSLTGRMQGVFIDGVSSPVFSLQFGVPQGSVLGPLLFTLYTSPVGDIAECYDVKYHLYADDTQIYLSLDADGRVQKKLVEDCVRDISKWMAVNKLKLNCDKTHASSFSETTTALISALKDYFGETVMSCDVAKPPDFDPLDCG
ncbi:reverse transcriptase [Elysia marginata]|uniref:Reverse transcriptase n=1 Tax=Elysia marginata TaxID=1093978 RepID=A0AAV4GCU9_9GAST|nr:reverse transcriptase [Elysia marginata]